MKSLNNAHLNTSTRKGMDSTTKMHMSATMSASKRTNVECAVPALVRIFTPGFAYERRIKSRGFSLIELLIVIAIIGIIAAIAVPSYSIYITTANRTDAMNFLSEVAGEQQRYFSENNEYATAMSDLGYGTADTFPSPEAHYTISVSNPNGEANGYLLSATPVAGGRQAGDDECNVFTMSSTGVKANTGGSNSNCW